jgi:predicted transcriptional regulator
LQPGDSRDIIVDILQVLINASKSKQMLSSEQIEKQVIEARKNNSTPLTGTASSNIRRQLKRLRDIFLIEKIKNEYRLTEFSDIRTIFEEKILKYYLSSISERIYEYSDMLDGRSSNTHTDS